MRSIDETYTLATPRPSEIVLREGCFDEIPERLAGRGRICLVTDGTVGRLYAKKLFEKLPADSLYFVCPDGENAKTETTLFSLLTLLSGADFLRTDLLLAVGGGTVTDLCGLAASLYMRGIRWISVPTTLLCAADAGIGGKTAIDFAGRKNLIGTFWQPTKVFLDPALLRSLPDSLFEEGMAEILKCALLLGSDLPGYLSAGGSPREGFEEYLLDAVRLKLRLVELDERDEAGKRVLLNAGHTVGHAIEALSGMNVPHGQAVATGLCVEAEIALSLGLCAQETVDTIRLAVRAIGYTGQTDFSKKDLFRVMKSDKKNTERNAVNMVLPTEDGYRLTAVPFPKEN